MLTLLLLGSKVQALVQVRLSAKTVTVLIESFYLDSSLGAAKSISPPVSGVFYKRGVFLVRRSSDGIFS